MKAGRRVDDSITFADLTPAILAAASLPPACGHEWAQCS